MENISLVIKVKRNSDKGPEPKVPNIFLNAAGHQIIDLEPKESYINYILINKCIMNKH